MKNFLILYLTKFKIFNEIIILLLLVNGTVFSAPSLTPCASFQVHTTSGSRIPNKGINQDNITNQLDNISKEIQQIIDADKSQLLPITLQMISQTNTTTLPFSSGTYGKILSKIEFAMKQIHSKTSFRARISVLPDSLCDHLVTRTEQKLEYLDNKEAGQTLSKTEKMIQSLIDNLPDLTKSHENNYMNDNELQHGYLFKGKSINYDKLKSIYHDFYDKDQQDEIISFSTNTYNHSTAPQKNFELIGLNFNLKYEVKQQEDVMKNLPYEYNADITGGILITVPQNFQYPLNIPIQLQDSPVGNIYLKTAQFENDPNYPSIKNYIAINFENIKFTNILPDSQNLSNSINNPRIHLYFSDEVKFNYNVATNKMSLVPSFEFPMRSLLINITTDGCAKCEKYTKLNLPINHLILDIEPFEIFTEDPITNQQTYLGSVPIPKLRFPNHKYGEKGGLRFSLRADGLTRSNKYELLTFYLNGDSIANEFIGGKKLTEQGVNSGYTWVLEKIAANAAYIKEVLDQVMDSSKIKNKEQPIN